MNKEDLKQVLEYYKADKQTAEDVIGFFQMP